MNTVHTLIRSTFLFNTLELVTAALFSLQRSKGSKATKVFKHISHPPPLLFTHQQPLKPSKEEHVKPAMVKYITSPKGTLCQHNHIESQSSVGNTGITFGYIECAIFLRDRTTNNCEIGRASCR